MAERIDDLILGNLKIIQDPSEFCFAIDAVLLAHFPELKRGMKVLDLGTGTGVIPLILTTREAELDTIVGLEIQTQMANMAERSVLLNGLKEKIKIINGDIKNILELNLKDKFDLILSNPPYKPLGQGKTNPKESIAIARHEIKVTLQELVMSAAKVMKHGGKLAIVHLADRLADLIYIFRENNIEPKRLRLVYPSAGTVAKLLLIEGVLGAKPGLTVMEPLHIYEESGVYCTEILSLYGLNGGKTLG